MARKKYGTSIMSPSLVMPADNINTNIPNQMMVANEARFNESYFSEPLTTFATGWRDPNNLEATLEFLAPNVPTARRFEFAQATNTEEFLSETEGDIRSLGASFKRVEYTSSKVNEKTHNKGLTVRVDLDEVADQPNWREQTTGRLMRRLLRNEIRRALTLISAAANNTAKTWDTSAGKDPDQDAATQVIAAGDANGLGANRIVWGLTAWNKRKISHRAQNTAGGFASAGMTPQEAAEIIGCEEGLVSKERYQSTAAAKAQIVNDLVLMFFAEANQSPEDPSNVKRFVSASSGGGNFAVFEQQVGPKLIDISVEHYSNIVITSTLGIEQLTIS